MCKKLFAFIGLAGIAVSSPALAFQDIPFDTEGFTLPFTNTARGVQDYANKQNWGSRKKVTFTDIGDNSWFKTPCAVNTPGDGFIMCGGGYVEVADPLGSKICELKKATGFIYYIETRSMKYNTLRCSTK